MRSLGNDPAEAGHFTCPLENKINFASCVLKMESDNSKLKIIIFLGIILAVLLLPKISWAATYWVSPTGSASWNSSGCQSNTDPGTNKYCSLRLANTNLAAGDTAILKGGTYDISDATYGKYGIAINPHHSGTANSKIVYVAETLENPPVFSSAAGSTNYGLIFGSPITNNYIKIDGITFKNFSAFGNIQNFSSYNEITNCTFTSDLDRGRLTAGLMIIGGYCAPNYNCWVTNNWIHGNTFSGVRAADPCGEAQDTIKIGHVYGVGGPTTDDDNYNTIEDNYFEYVGHTHLDTFSMYNVIRNNIFHNEPWITGCTGTLFTPVYVNESYNGKYAHRNMQITDGYSRRTYILVEGNRLGHASANPNNPGAKNFEIASAGNIIRHNYFYNSMNDGIAFKYPKANASVPGENGLYGKGGSDNRLYNNTIYHSGYGFAGTPAYYALSGLMITNTTPSVPTGNVVKNNLFYGSSQYDITTFGYGVDPNTWATVAHNWCTNSTIGCPGCTSSAEKVAVCSGYGDPKFTNPDITNPLSQNLFSTVHGYVSTPLPDLSLQASSPAINGGTYLTRANGSGANITALIVNDALYFQDGTWGSDLARGITLFPDWIAIGTVNNAVRISSINYDTNTITLASPMTWNDGANIWLYKKSDGTQVLYGSAPDYGAYEYASAAPPPDATPPAAPSGVAVF